MYEVGLNFALHSFILTQGKTTSKFLLLFITLKEKRNYVLTHVIPRKGPRVGLRTQRGETSEAGSGMGELIIRVLCTKRRRDRKLLKSPELPHPRKVVWL